MDSSTFYEGRKFNYHFDDPVLMGNRQPITQNNDYKDKIKIMKYGSIVRDSELIESLNIPLSFDLQKYISEIYDQGKEDIACSCAISSAITIRTNYINAQRYTLTWLFFGNKFKPIIPSVLYINWNARAQGGKVKDKNGKMIIPSIYSHLSSIESHKIVDCSKYTDDISSKIRKEPDLMAFYHASKTSQLCWFKVKPDEVTLKYLIFNGYPIICGINIYSGFFDPICFTFGHISLPKDISEKSLGAHVILLTGYNDNKRRFSFVNSLSKKWGADGIGYIEYDYIMNPNFAGDFAYLEYVF